MFSWVFFILISSFSTWALPAFMDESQEPTLGEVIRAQPDLPLDYEVEPRLLTCDFCEIRNQPGSLITVPARDGRANISVLEKSEVDEIYRDIMAPGSDLGRGIDFTRLEDGCYARAHLLYDRLAKKGIRTAKIFLSGNSGVKNPDGVYQWKYHVATAVYVRENGQLRLMVIDPTLFNRAVTATEWIRKQNSAPPLRFDQLFLTSGTAYMPRDDMSFPPHSFRDYLANVRDAERVAAPQPTSPSP